MIRLVLDRAIREAFVKEDVHGDYSVQATLELKRLKIGLNFIIQVVSKIPVADIYKGGTSKCRNPFIQKMFRMIGFGENIGSGFFKILKAWERGAVGSSYIRRKFCYK